MRLGALYDVLQHRHEAHVLFVLQANGIGAVCGSALIDQRKTTGRQQTLRWQLFTTQADHKYFIAKVGVEADVA
jgi:hypothetical protein